MRLPHCHGVDVKACLLALWACIFTPQAVQACDDAITQPLSFVSLWNAAAAVRMGNLAQIDRLCGKADYSAECLQKALGTQAKLLPVYQSPGDSAFMGAILVRYVPGAGIETSYLDLDPALPGSRIMLDFRPDLFQRDDGYGPVYFHQTLLARQDGWFRIALPQVVKHTGWIRLADPRIVQLGKGDIVTYQDKGYVILKVGKDAITLRAEIPGDMVCNGIGGLPDGSEPKLTIPLKDAYDNTCHLLLAIRYPRGCP